MDFSSPTAGSPDVFLSVEELADEIAYQQTMLQAMLESIDHTKQDPEEAVASVRVEIRHLMRQLKAKEEEEAEKRNIYYNHSGSVVHPRNFFPHNAESFGSLSTMTANKTSASGASSSSPSTPKSGTSKLVNNMLSPSLPTRKRSSGESHKHDGGNKSRRTSQSPHVSRPSTPASGTGDDDTSRYIVQRQKHAQEKAKQEAIDADLAKKLDDEERGYAAPVMPTQPQSSSFQSGVSAFDRLLGRAPSQSQHRFGQPSSAYNVLPQPSQPSAVGTRTFGMSGPSAFSAGPSVKAEASSAPQMNMPGSFPRESTADSDSDIEVISATAFQDNGRQSFLKPNGSQRYRSGRAAVDSSADALAERARQVAISRLANPHLQYGANYNPHGVSLPTPAGMGMRQPGGSILGYTAYESPGMIGNGVYQNGHVIGMDPLQSIFQGAYNAEWTMTDENRMADLNDYINDPRKTAQEIKELIDNIRPDEEIPKENREGTPDGLKYALYEHQKLALTWLKSMEEGTNKGGVLADDMGLGKTISALALILSRPSTERTRKTTLIVGPVALVRQWEREIYTKLTRSHRLSTFLYHSGKKASWDVLRNFNIVLTTYGTLGSEYKRLEAFENKLKDNPDLDKTEITKKCPFLGEPSKWYRVILDEAQYIKNKSTMAAKGCCRLQSRFRFCLTGTPMMNGVHELYSLIHFLRIRPYNEHSKFTADFGCLSKSTAGTRNNPRTEQNAMRKLQAVLKAMMLRRTKSSKIDGKDILTLPHKTEEIVHAIFDEEEQAYYTGIETKAATQFNKYVRAGTVGKNYANALVLLLRLRQAACHPHLIMDFEDAPPEASVDDMINLAKSLLPDVIGRIIAATVPFECPVCYDPVPNPRIVIPCGHDTCAGCLVRISATAQQEGVANGDDNAQNNAKCPTCRGKIDNAKIIDYETFKNVHMKGVQPTEDVDDETESDDDGDDVSVDSDSSTSDSDLESDADSDGDIRDFVVPDDYESDAEVSEDDNDEFDEEEDEDGYANLKRPSSASDVKKKGVIVKGEVKDEDSDEDFVDVKDIKPINKDEATAKKAKASRSKASKSNPAKKAKKSKKSKKSRKGKGKSNDKEKVAIGNKGLSTLKKEASRSAEGRRRYMRYLRKNWISSAKVDKCMEILDNTAPGIKTIIFSQFTTLLDLVEVPLRQKRVGLTRYDGSMTADARNSSVVNFTDDPTIPLMLVSLKAGNAGLNLVAASQVIILDPFWNPFVEMQAVDRAHRIGQQKPVAVHRILVKGTVEDRIIELQDKKRALIEAALDENASAGIGRLGQQELIYLFNGGDGVQRETMARPAIVYGPRPVNMDTPSPSPSGSSGP